MSDGGLQRRCEELVSVIFLFGFGVGFLRLRWEVSGLGICGEVRRDGRSWSAKLTGDGKKRYGQARKGRVEAARHSLPLPFALRLSFLLSSRLSRGKGE